jgi:hypothetical protein
MHIYEYSSALHVLLLVWICLLHVERSITKDWVPTQVQPTLRDLLAVFIAIQGVGQTDLGDYPHPEE